MHELLRVEIEPGGRLLVEAKNRDGEYARIHQADEIQDTTPSLPVVVGVQHIFRLPNSHFCDKYDVSVINGSFTFDGEYIYYTPLEEGYGEIRVNGTIKPLVVITNRPLTPTITYPPQGAIDLPDGFEITTSAFVSADPSMSHYATRWQIATDPDFVEVVFDETSTTDLVDMATFGLDEGIAHYIRALHIGQIA